MPFCWGCRFLPEKEGGFLHIYCAVFGGRKHHLFPTFVDSSFPLLCFHYGCPFCGIYPSIIPILWLCPFCYGTLLRFFCVFMFVFLCFWWVLLLCPFIFVFWFAFFMFCMFYFVFYTAFLCFLLFVFRFFCFLLFVFRCFSVLCLSLLLLVRFFCFLLFGFRCFLSFVTLISVFKVFCYSVLVFVRD